MDSLPSMLGGLVKQFQQGQHDQVPEDQLHQGYGQVASQLSPADYQQSAASAYETLTPAQRADFAEFLRQRSSEQGIATPALGAPSNAISDPNALATATTAIHQQDPNLLQQMFAPGGKFSSPVAKLVMLGITAFAAQRLGHR